MHAAAVGKASAAESQLSQAGKRAAVCASGEQQARRREIAGRAGRPAAAGAPPHVLAPTKGADASLPPPVVAGHAAEAGLAAGEGGATAPHIRHHLVLRGGHGGWAGGWEGMAGGCWGGWRGASACSCGCMSAGASLAAGEAGATKLACAGASSRPGAGHVPCLRSKRRPCPAPPCPAHGPPDAPPASPACTPQSPAAGLRSPPGQS